VGLTLQFLESATLTASTPSPATVVVNTGLPGPQGPAGVGVAAGGTAGQVLAKIDATDYNTHWVDAGGGTGYATESWVLSQGYITGAALSPYLTTAAATSTYLTITNAASTYATNAALSSYLTVAAASSTYFPIPTGTTAQYIAGNGSLITFPTVFTANKMTAVVYNQTGSVLLKGQVVYINGAHGNLPTVALSQANAESTSAGTYGFVASNIADNASGTIVIAGIAENLDTQYLADGDKLYLSPTVAGGYTTTKPSAPEHMVYLGVVTRAHPTQGTIQLRIANGFELEELHNVSAETPSNDDFLVYESATELWKNKTLASVGDGLYYSVTNPAGYIDASALTGYATEYWVGSQGYLTSVPPTPPDQTKADLIAGLVYSVTSGDYFGVLSTYTNPPAFILNLGTNWGIVDGANNYYPATGSYSGSFFYLSGYVGAGPYRVRVNSTDSSFDF